MSAIKPHSDTLNSIDLAALVALAEEVAVRFAGGHISIFRFSTHWKACVGTVDLDSRDGRAQVADLKPHGSLREALIDLIVEGRRKTLP